MPIINLELPTAKRGTKDFLKGQVTAPLSRYNPSKKDKERISEVMQKFTLAYEVMHKPYREFNDESLITHMTDLQKLWNSYREPKSENPDDAWKSQTVRPIVRNRAVSIAAHVTGTVIHPVIQAQNKDQQTDKDASVVMRGLMEWANDQADYVKTFLYAVIGALVNPATIIHTEYCEVHREIKEEQEDGEYKKKMILDDVLSGFKDTLVPLDELLISDIYEHDIQRQPYIIWRRVIPWTTAYAKYADNKLFTDHVKPGVQVMFDAASDAFYEVFDENLSSHLVEEAIYYDRYQDLQLRFVNGVLLDRPDKPNPRKDKMYPFVKGGYELIDEGKFFYYFSLVRKMKDDAEIVNTLYNMVIDGTFLQLMPPTAVFGDEYINSSVVTPGTVTTFRENTKLQKIDVGNNLQAGFNTLDKIESSIQESSNDTLQSGQKVGGAQTAFEISRLEQNANVMLGMFAKMIGFMVKDLGILRIGDIVHYMTVGEIDEIVGDDASLKYRSFLVPNQEGEGRKRNHRIMFGDFEGKFPQDETQRGFDLLAMEGGAEMDAIPNLQPEERETYIAKGFKEAEDRIYLVNPTLFRNLKYKVIVTPDTVTPQSEALERALNIEEYDRAVMNPLANQEAIYQDLLLGSYKKTKDNPDKYTAEQTQMMGQGGQPPVEKIFGAGAEGNRNMAANQPITR